MQAIPTLKRQVTVHIPDTVMAALIEESRDLDRSRSWVIEQALRQYLAERLETATPPGAE